MKKIDIDIETYSDISLKDSGVYRYSESPNFDILLFGYSIDNGPVNVIDLAQGEKIPDNIISALTDDKIIKWAHNASFERICLSAYLNKNFKNVTKCPYLSPASWRCSMVWCSYLGLPMSLEAAGKSLKLENQKLSEGKDLIKLFCCPVKPTKANGMKTRMLPDDNPEKWHLFKEYNKKDVEAEQGILHKLRNFPVPDFVWDEYSLSEEINDRGILLDMDLVKNAIEFDDKSKAEIAAEMKKIANIENPNSTTQLKEWLTVNGVSIDSLGKSDVANKLNELEGDNKRLLELRLQIAKSSVSKYKAMVNSVSNDGRARGCFIFYGARTGRWTSRRIQFQNMRANKLEDLDNARNLLIGGDYDSFKNAYSDVPDVLSQLVRTALIPRPGYKYIVSDFSAIEARVLAYLANEQWRIDVFDNGRDIYCESASRMFGVPVEKNGINNHLRQKGKISELALGYGGSVGAMKKMGALEMGIPEDELQSIVDSWREANPNIVNFWWDVGRCVEDAIVLRQPKRLGYITFEYKKGLLLIGLPSGRKLSYVRPKIEANDYGSVSVTYESSDSLSAGERVEAYGPKFVENIVQAVSRDILSNSMKNLKNELIVGTVHDEIIIEAPLEASVEDICLQMGKSPDWLPGINLKADGYECRYYKKD